MSILIRGREAFCGGLAYNGVAGGDVVMLQMVLTVLVVGGNDSTCVLLVVGDTGAKSMVLLRIFYWNLKKKSVTSGIIDVSLVVGCFCAPS